MGSALDAETLRRSMSLFAEALRDHRAEIDSLNVFPVPDGDTGTNLSFTQQAVVEALAGLDPAAAGDLAAVADAIARASLIGARGNSGVILSQILRALTGALATGGSDGRALARGLERAAAEARLAVARPVDGTILSVLGDAASAASAAAGDGADLAGVADAALAEARRSLAGTPDRLPELRRAGVVDAGAKGLVLLLDALRAAAGGHPLSEPAGPPGPAGAAGDGDGWSPGRFGLEVQYLLEADGGRIPELREELGRIGDSVVVVGGGGLYNVHVHTDDPDAAVAIGGAAGEPSAASITPLRASFECIGGQARGVQVAERQRSALVAVAEGEGLVAAFRSLGATVVRAGPGRTVAAEDLAGALEAAPSAEIVVLAGAELRPLAQRAASGGSKAVRFLDMPSVPAALAAATAFNPQRSVEDNALSAGEAAAGVRAGSVAAGPGSAPAAAELAARLASDVSELVTVVVGGAPSEDEVRRVAEALQQAVPGAEVQVVRGGQDEPAFLIGVE